MSDKTHPLLAYRIKHPVPCTEDIKPGDHVVLKTWEVNPSRNAHGHKARIRRARMNYPLMDAEIRTLLRRPVAVLEVLNAPRCIYVDLAKYFGKGASEKDHGKRWLLMSDVRKVQA